MTSRLTKRIVSILACVLVLGIGGGASGTAQQTTEWQTAYLTQSAILDIATTDDGSAWAVGEAGTILRYVGEAWERISSPTDETLNAVTLSSADEGWAVGKAGTILRLQATTWHSASTPTTAADELFDVVTVEGAGWAVGQRYNTISASFEGLILRLDDGMWTEVAIPQGPSLYACAFESADEGWAVGKGGTVLRWNGSEWAKQTSPTNVDLHDIIIVGEEVWAVGDKGVIVHWTPQGLQIEPSPYDVTLRRVGFASPDAGWAVGAENTIFQYNGQRWSPISTSLDLDLFGLFVNADGIPWVTGGGGLVARVMPDGWEMLTQPYVNVDLTAIDMLGAKAGWAIGGQPFQPAEGMIFWQHTGRLWNPHQNRDAPPLFDIDVLSEDEAWAVGMDPLVENPAEAGVVWHYSDGVWKTAARPGVSALYAVEAISSSDVWVAGQDGTLMHYDGTTWQTTPMPENVHLYGLHFPASSDGWAVGERLDLVQQPPRYVAVAFHFDGEGWDETTVPTGPPRLLGVHALSERDVWAVGNLGAILHYDGERWTLIQGQQEYNLLDVDFAGPGDGWAVGTQGTILRYHVDAWTSGNSPTSETLNGVVSWSWGEAWAVGTQGTFLHHPPVKPWRVFVPLVGHK